MNHAEATREVLWNITHVWVMYALFVLTLAVAAFGVYRRARMWRRGRAVARFDRPLARLAMLLRYAVLHQGVWRRRMPGLYHAAIFWGFVTLVAGTTVVMLDYDFGLPLMRGRFYLYFQSLFVDVMGLAATIGCIVACVRRWVIRPRELVYTSEASILLVVLLIILVSGFVVEGLRIAATDDPWAAYSPIGRLVARGVEGRMSHDGMLTAHRALWWGHLVVSFGLIAYAPYTKLFHALSGPLNAYTARLAPHGAALLALDFERDQTLGVRTLADFTWKDLLDLDACTECGRCTAVCPANVAGKALSPRDVILDLRGLAYSARDATDRPLVGAAPALSSEALWQCTTCAACMDACPVAIDQMTKIVDLRRYLVMEEAAAPSAMNDALRSLETRQHPMAGSQCSRLDWAAGLDVATIAEQPDAEVLLWVGCGGALVERNQQVTRALAQLLAKAGVHFAILGRDEACTGDVARRMGNEFLFQTLARDNIATLERHDVKTVVTACPHCFNTFRNEYPALGARFEVFHHSDYLDRLVSQGRLSPKRRDARPTAFHDPCYLGRHNGVYDAPRRLVQLAVDQTSELPRNRRESFCCGGGGGMSFVDEPAEARVSRERAQEAVASGAEVLAVGCPFCMTMLEDGINAAGGQRKVEVRDVAEILWDSVRDDEAPVS